MCVVVEGSMKAELPGGVAWAFMGVVVVVVGTVSRTGFPWTDGAFEAASSSESSEMKPSSGISVMTGRSGALGVVSVAEAVALCFFFGCGSSVGCDLGNSGADLPLVGPSRAGDGGWLTTDIGFRVWTSASRCPASSRGLLTIVRGRRFGPGFKIMWVGRPA